MAGFVVVLDANVLYGIEVTDLLATMATRRLFRPHWSPEILDEVVRNLARRPDLDPHAIERRVAHLNRALPGALMQIPPALFEAMPINENDRHVLALAVHVGAPTIVTDNLRDFPADLLDPFGVEAISSDAFAHLGPVDGRPVAPPRRVLAGTRTDAGLAEGKLLAAQHRLGHRDLSTTLRHYGWAQAPDDLPIADHLDKVLNGRT